MRTASPGKGSTTAQRSSRDTTSSMSVRKSTRRITSLRSSGLDVATMMATFARCRSCRIDMAQKDAPPTPPSLPSAPKAVRALLRAIPARGDAALWRASRMLPPLLYGMTAKFGNNCKRDRRTRAHVAALADLPRRLVRGHSVAGNIP
jgi:hypothetical protein